MSEHDLSFIRDQIDAVDKDIHLLLNKRAGLAQEVAEIKLRDDFVHANFYEVLGRLGTENERAQDADLFKQYKTELSEALWNESLTTAFYKKLLY